MIKVQVKHLNRADVQRALYNLNECKTLSGFLAYQVSKIAKELSEKHLKIMDGVREKAKELADKDEKGRPKIEDNKYVLSEEARKTLEEIEKSEGEIEVTVENRQKIGLSLLDSAGLSPHDFFALEFMIDETK